MEVMQLLRPQRFWQHQVCRGIGSYGSRKYSALEGYGNKYWPIHSSILAWRTPLPDRESWQAIVYRVTKRRTLPKQPCMHRHKTFLPVAALPQCDLSVKVVQLFGLWGPWRDQVCRDTNSLHHRSYGPIRVFFQASCSWRSEDLFGQSFSVALPIQALRGLPCLGSLSVVQHDRHREGPPQAGVQLCRLAHQAFKGAPWERSYSVVQLISHLKEYPGWGPTL